jgi:predicted DsbA family dithiol-disulfide isomerase
MDNEPERPELRVTVFSDYICPFCFIGSRRLLRLNEAFELRVNWCGVEIHPETPPAGMPVARLGYEPAQWTAMMENLQHMAADDGLVLREHDFTTNSHKALLLADSAKEAGREPFYALHEGLFRAFHVEGKNIGDESVLRRLSTEAGIPKAMVERAWRDERFEERLRQNLQAAAQIGLRGTPTFLIGRQVIAGAIPYSQLELAARLAAAEG